MIIIKDVILYDLENIRIANQSVYARIASKFFKGT